MIHNRKRAFNNLKPVSTVCIMGIHSDKTICPYKLGFHYSWSTLLHYSDTDGLICT